jgi:dipeptidyl aminopeptidase/acylaminoacyl peptidase
MKLRHFATVAAFLLAVACPPAVLAAKDLEGDAITRQLLKDPEFERIAVSPDGTMLAIARHLGEVTTVTVHKRADMHPMISFDPGARGVISSLEWIDNTRLLVGATRLTAVGNFAAFEPILVIASLDGTTPKVLPGNFFALSAGDPGHILVGDCAFGKGNKGCNLPQIRRDDIGHLIRKGELVMEGPPDTRLIANDAATAGFAIKWEDDDTAKTYVYHPADKSWSLLNDGSVSGLEVVPVAVSRDGKTGYLQAERKAGPDMIERYDFATGKRADVYADPVSDPLLLYGSFDAAELIGGLYDPTSPTGHYWSPGHADAQLRTQLQAAFPGMRIDVLDQSSDHDTIVLGVGSDRDPGAWYVFDRKARKATLVTATYPWLDVAAQAPQTPVEFKSRDGLVLHGLLTVPLGGNGRNLPLVVVPHGGPYWIHDTRGFDAENQILAQHGYAVLQVNFRGSGGYGHAFFAAGTRQWGRAMQDDVTDATRWAITQGIADAGRICIYGMSYGGYAALMGPIREPGLYQCAASYAGPTDLTKITKWGSSRRDALSRKWHAKMLGEGADLVPISPALNADKLNVPVLIAQGYLDARVDVRHAQAMRSKLSGSNAHVDYVEYRDTGHFLLVEKHREDFYTRLLHLLDTTIGKSRVASAAR